MDKYEYRCLPYHVDGCNLLVRNGNNYVLKTGPYKGTIFRYNINTDWLVSINRPDDQLKIPWIDITTGFVKVEKEPLDA